MYRRKLGMLSRKSGYLWEAASCMIRFSLCLSLFSKCPTKNGCYFCKKKCVKVTLKCFIILMDTYGSCYV